MILINGHSKINKIYILFTVLDKDLDLILLSQRQTHYVFCSNVQKYKKYKTSLRSYYKSTTSYNAITKS